MDDNQRGSKAETKTGFFDRIQYITEYCLTRRRMNLRLKKEKQKGKNPILDWLEAFVWAASVVLLINQYLFQAYQIPSGSMIDTLLIKDHIFVNKLVYGPELLPGVGKVPSPVKPKRNDIIIFENPSYISRGPVFDISQRIIYMLTLSLVDIDRDEFGQPKAHFLIKRAAGIGGDHFKGDRGEMSIRFSGEDRWVKERDYTASQGWGHRISRLIQAGEYDALIAAGKVAAYSDMMLMPPESLVKQASPALIESSGAARRGGYEILPRYRGDFAFSAAYLAFTRGAYPHDSVYETLLARQLLGWYVPEGRILPLGDNRDNSRDGRYFGPVRLTKILGKGSFIYWPLLPKSRIGFIR